MDVLEGVPGAKLADPLVFAADGSTKQSSPNHEAQAWAIEAARAAYESSRSAKVLSSFSNAKRTPLDAYFPRELAVGPRGIGLWASEQGCPDSHDGQHLNGTSMARLAAWISRDPELLEWSERLLLTTVRALLCVATPSLEVWQAGFRSPGKPTSSAATAWLRMATGEKNAGKSNWMAARSDPFYLQTRVLDYLRKAGDPLLARTAQMTRDDAAPCTLKYPMEVYRSEDGKTHLSLLTMSAASMNQRGDVCGWVRASDGGVTWGAGDSPVIGKDGMRLTHRFPGINERKTCPDAREGTERGQGRKQ